MVYRNEQTPYAQRMAKENAPDMSAGTLITSGAVINKSIEDYITIAARDATTLDVIRRIMAVPNYRLNYESKAMVLDAILTEEEKEE